MNFNQMNEAVKEAENTLHIADMTTEKLLSLLVGRLRNIKNYNGHTNLSKLKKELKNYNSTTREWK